MRLVEEQPARLELDQYARRPLCARRRPRPRNRAVLARRRSPVRGRFPAQGGGALQEGAEGPQRSRAHAVRLSDIAARQGLLADAKQFLRQLAQQRKARGDHKGVADCILRMATIDENDGDAKVAAARTAEEMGDIAHAVTLFQDAAAAYEKQKRDSDALNAEWQRRCWRRRMTGCAPTSRER